MLVKHTRFPIKQMLTVGLLPGPLKNAYYRARGARIGPRVAIGPGSVIVADEIEIGEGVTIGFGTYLKARRVQIGRFARIGSASFLDAETITIGEDARINEQVFVGGLSSPESHLRIGARTIIMQHTFINAACPVTIGDDTGIGGRCSIFTHGSWQNMLDGYPVTFAPVTIGNNVWIPWQVFIMPGVTIGDGATIGAASLVTKDVPAGALAVGSPAKVIRTAAEYPVVPDHAQRTAMLQQMLLEFCEYLEYDGLEIERSGVQQSARLRLPNIRDRQPGFERITVVERSGTTHQLVVYYDDALDSQHLSGAEVVLSLVELDARARQMIGDQRGMWLDLDRKQRGGASTPLGEELAEFVRRYGIRCVRTL